jgi:hypothetical protein
MRTSLLINCSEKEAHEVRRRAGLQRRTVSGYVVNIVLRSVEFSEEVVSGLRTLPLFRLGQRLARALAPRTTLHVYCSTDEAKRIRGAARLAETTISSFVLHCLRRSWDAEDSLVKIQRRRPGQARD